jgi:ferrous iron transport protein B
MTAPALIQVAAAPKLIAIIGPPNCGKSTLFNRLTGLRQKVGNYPGVTVEQRTGRMQCSGGWVEFVDLPGISSLTSHSDEERVTLDVLYGRMTGLRRPDAVLLVLDSTALDRHLPLAALVLGLGLPTLLALNMSDELSHRGGALDEAQLSAQLGIPVQLISAKYGDGVDGIYRFLINLPSQAPRLQLPVLQGTPECRRWASRTANCAGFQRPARSVWTSRLDAFALHPIGGPILFVLVMIAVFQSISVLARPLQELCEQAIQSSAGFVRAVLPPSPLRSLLTEGVWPGVGTVLAFLPQILILFLWIGILEDSGYLARAAVVADRAMSKFGLQGKAFIPLLSGYACAIPAIMATRTIENKRDRLATILIVPFMTCSARLPVYTMIVGAFIPERPLLGPLLGSRAAAMIGLYAAGFLGGAGTAWLLKSTVLSRTASCFLMELPPYRWPSFRCLALQLFDRAKIFVYRAGTTILAVCIGLWLLTHLPIRGGHYPYIEESFAGELGASLAPLLKPLGLNWKIGIGLITSLLAREVIVGTLGALYGMERPAESGDLAAALHRDLTTGGAAALVVFFAFALQCVSTLVVVRRETGSWKWSALQFVYMGTFAYIAAWITNQLVNAIVG